MKKAPVCIMRYIDEGVSNQTRYINKFKYYQMLIIVQNLKNLGKIHGKYIFK